MQPFRWWIIGGVLLSFATSGASVGLMAVSAYLISKAALARDLTDLAVWITGVRFFAVSRAALRYAERYITHLATFRILTRLRVWFYAAIEPLAPARLASYRSGDLLTRIVADIETLENFYLRVVIPPLAAALVTLLACLILGSFDLALAAALLVFILLTGVALPLASRWLSRQPAADAIDARAELNASLVDEIQGIADLLAYGQEAAFQAKTRRLGRQLSRAQERLALVRGLGNGLGALFASLAGLTVLFLAIPLVTSGQIDGVFLALLPLTAIATFEAVQPLSQAMQMLEASQGAARRVFDLIDAEPAVIDAPELSGGRRDSALNRPNTAQPTPPIILQRADPAVLPIDRSTDLPTRGLAIDVHNLRFRYAPDEPLVLDGLSFSVPAGGRVVITGPNGSGKSSLVSLLLRFWGFEAGSIHLGGHDVRDLAADDVRALVGVAPQQTHLFNATIRDNLYLANPDASDADLVAACRQAQLHDFIQSLPQGYNTQVGENGLLLSGGERQRLAIARAILKNAPIFILDEATSQLDAVTEQRLLQSLADFMATRTTLLISHRRAGLAHFDRIDLETDTSRRYT
jgi:ATP-binding cassette, subfamily C, bacterial CydC